MTDDRVPTELWVSGHLRQFTVQNIPAYIIRKGDLSTGTVMVKVVMPQKQCRLFNQSRDIDGKMGWMDVFEEVADEKRADDYIARSLARDPDLWVVEIEKADGSNPFEGRVF